MDTMKVSKLNINAKLPTRKNSTDAGLDLYAYLYEQDWVDIKPNGVWTIHTGVTVEIPVGYFGWITNKSKNNFLIGGGIVDEGYQGELLVKVINTSDEHLKIYNYQSIAQLLIIPCKILDIEELPLSEIHQEKTARGNTGGIVTQVDVSPWDIISANSKLVGFMDDGTPLYGMQIRKEDDIDNYDYVQDDLNFDAARERRMR